METTINVNDLSFKNRENEEIRKTNWRIDSCKFYRKTMAA